LEVLEGHFTRGYGDSQKPDVEIALLDGAAKDANAFLAECGPEHTRLERVSRLIEGFETPYGMELLASVHWLAVHQTPPASSADAAASGMAAWNARKQKMFQPAHINVAWERLAEEKWIPVATGG